MTGPSLDLDALREKAEKATPGPWRHDDYDPKAVVIGPAEDVSDVAGTWKTQDAAYVAAASPDVILAVLALVDEYRKENERLRGALRLIAENAYPVRGREVIEHDQLAREALAGSPAENKDQT